MYHIQANLSTSTDRFRPRPEGRGLLSGDPGDGPMAGPDDIIRTGVMPMATFDGHVILALTDDARGDLWKVADIGRALNVAGAVTKLLKDVPTDRIHDRLVVTNSGRQKAKFVDTQGVKDIV